MLKLVKFTKITNHSTKGNLIMSYYIKAPNITRRMEQAWMHAEQYLGEEHLDKLQALFIQCSLYGYWARCCAMLGISGWPVVAIWDDMRQTCRDMQS